MLRLQPRFAGVQPKLSVVVALVRRLSILIILAAVPACSPHQPTPEPTPEPPESSAPVEVKGTVVAFVCQVDDEPPWAKLYPPGEAPNPCAPKNGVYPAWWSDGCNSCACCRGQRGQMCMQSFCSHSQLVRYREDGMPYVLEPGADGWPMKSGEGPEEFVEATDESSIRAVLERKRVPAEIIEAAIAAEEKRRSPWEPVPTQVDGVRVFFWPDELPEVPEGTVLICHEARLQGEARIVEGCLYVGDTVAIWRSDRYDEIQAAIRSVKMGKEVILTDVGSGLWSDPSTGGAEAQPEVWSENAKTIIARCPAASDVFGTCRL